MRIEHQQAYFRRPGAKQLYIIKDDQIRAMFQLRIFCHLVCYIKFSNEQNNNIYPLLFVYETFPPFRRKITIWMFVWTWRSEENVDEVVSNRRLKVTAQYWVWPSVRLKKWIIMKRPEITVKIGYLHLVEKHEVKKRILFNLFHGLGHHGLLKNNMSRFIFDITWFWTKGLPNENNKIVDYSVILLL